MNLKFKIQRAHIDTQNKRSKKFKKWDESHFKWVTQKWKKNKKNILGTLLKKKQVFNNEIRQSVF